MNELKNDFRNYATKHLNLPGTSVDGVMKHQVGAYSTPYILEEREMRATQLDIFSRMLMDRILVISGEVEDRMSDIIQAELMWLNSLNHNDITLHIRTVGGSVLSGNSIISVMNNIESDICTINMGLCASFGTVLLSSGTKGKRASLIHSKAMIHRVSAGSQGVIDSMRVSSLEAEKHNYILFKILAKNCGKTFDEIYNICEQDKWLNSDESKNIGLIDEVIGLDKSPSITELMDGFEDYYHKKVVSMIK